MIEPSSSPMTKVPRPAKWIRPGSVRVGLGRQQARLLEAYLAGAVDLATFEDKRDDLRRREEDVLAREREVVAQGQQLIAVEGIARSMTEMLEQLARGLQYATFDQRRQVVELLIDRVVVGGAARPWAGRPAACATCCTRAGHATPLGAAGPAGRSPFPGALLRSAGGAARPERPAGIPGKTLPGPGFRVALLLSLPTRCMASAGKRSPIACGRQSSRRPRRLSSERPAAGCANT